MTLRDATSVSGAQALLLRRRPAGRGASQELDRLEARVAELEHANAELQAFAAHAAHELIEPLVMAEAYAAMVTSRLGDEQEENRRDLETLSRGVGRTRLLVESILRQARSRNSQLARDQVDLARVVRDCLELLAPEIVSRGANVEVGHLPVVEGDRAQLGSVFNNLIINALKYGSREEGEIRIRAQLEGAWWRISVESHGPTLAAQDRARVFSAFSRASGERRARGTGLGLAICRDIVERHGGTIGVGPVNGSGNCFVFTLPA
jgi:signal transduction histidine kinase